MRLNKECMVCGGELWILEDEVEFYPNQYIFGKRIGTDRETVRCKCTTCGTEYTIEGEYKNLKELKEWVKVGEEMSKRAIKDIALELLKKYEESEERIIWEFSGNIDGDEEELRNEIESYKNEIQGSEA